MPSRHGKFSSTSLETRKNVITFTGNNLISRAHDIGNITCVFTHRAKFTKKNRDLNSTVMHVT